MSNPYGAPGEPPLRNPLRPPPGGRGDLREKGWVPLWRLAFWWSMLFASVVIFYVLLTPIGSDFAPLRGSPRSDRALGAREQAALVVSRPASGRA